MCLSHLQSFRGEGGDPKAVHQLGNLVQVNHERPATSPRSAPELSRDDDW